MQGQNLFNGMTLYHPWQNMAEKEFLGENIHPTISRKWDKEITEVPNAVTVFNSRQSLLVGSLLKKGGWTINKKR